MQARTWKTFKWWWQFCVLSKREWLHGNIQVCYFIEYSEFGTQEPEATRCLQFREKLRCSCPKLRCCCLPMVLSCSLIFHICKFPLMWITDFTPLCCTNVSTGHLALSESILKVGCYSNNPTEGSQAQLHDPTSHKSESMHPFDFLFKTSRKDVTESAPAGADNAQSNSPEGYPFFCYLSAGCFCSKFKLEQDYDTISVLLRGHSLIKQWNKASVSTLQPCKYLV